MACSGRAVMPQDEDQGEAHSQDAADQEVATEGGPYDEGRVDAQGFHKEAPHRVEAHVEHEDVAVLEAICEASCDPQQAQSNQQVPHRLVEKGRVEGGGVGEAHGPNGCDSVLRRYPYGPGQIRGPAEKLLIKVIAPASYGLAQGETRGGRVGEDQRFNATVAAKEEQAQKAASHRAVDPPAPEPEGEDLGQPVAVLIVFGGDVVEAGSDEAEWNDKEERVERQGTIVAPARELPPRNPGAAHYAQHDEQPVVTQDERPGLEDNRRGRARQREECLVRRDHLYRPSGRASARVEVPVVTRDPSENSFFWVRGSITL